MSGEDFVDDEGTAKEDAEQELARERRDSWFARELGEGWVPAGDGIYYPPSAAEKASLDEALRGSLSGTASEEREREAEEPVGRRRFWRR